MKQFIIFFYLILVLHTVNAQYTLIPDQQFEQALINQNIDSENVLDGRVLTIDINGLTALDLHGQLILDLTGIENFVSLETLNCSDNELQSLDVSNLLFLKNLSCGENELNGINLEFNTELVTFISSHSADDVGGNSFGEIDFSSNLKLENILINFSIGGNLDLKNNYLLKTIDVKNNWLVSLDLRNGANQNITSYNSTFNSISCLFVDDSSALYLDNWVIDTTTNFIETNEECTVLFTNEFRFSKIVLYPNPVADIINIDLPNDAIKKILIYNQIGQQLYVFNKNYLNVSKFKKGIYFLKLVTINKDVFVKSFVIE